MTPEQPLTVGRLRQLLANHHESDRIVLVKDEQFFNVSVGVERSPIGHVVTLNQGDYVSEQHIPGFTWGLPLDKLTKPEDLFGPLDIASLK